MRYALLALLLLSIHSTSAQSKWWMDADSIAHGPANDVFKWAGYRATVNEQNRDKTISYHLVARELSLAQKEIAAKDSTIKAQKVLIGEKDDRITFLSERVRKLEAKKPMRLVWFGAGVVAGWFTRQETQE